MCVPLLVCFFAFYLLAYLRYDHTPEGFAMKHPSIRSLCVAKAPQCFVGSSDIADLADVTAHGCNLGFEDGCDIDPVIRLGREGKPDFFDDVWFELRGKQLRMVAPIACSGRNGSQCSCTCREMIGVIDIVMLFFLL